MTSLAAEPIFGSWTVTLVIVAVVALALWRYQPPLVAPARRRTMALCRIVAAVTLLLILIRPALTRTDNRPTAATLLIGVDTSASMSVEVAGGGVDPSATSRYDVQRKALDQLQRQLETSNVGDQSIDVQLIGYDAAASTLPRSNGAGRAWSDALPPQPTGTTTDLSAALTAAGQTASSGPVLGMVLIGDGRQTPATDPAASSPGDSAATAATATAAAEGLAVRGVPLWAVPIGSESIRRRDVAVAGLAPAMRLYAGTDTDVTTEVSAAGAEGRDVTLRWSWIDADDQTEVAATRTVRPDAAVWNRSISVTIRTPPPGEYRLEVTATPIEGESIVSNNRTGSFVEVTDGGGRLLLLQGSVTLETSYLRRAIAGFADLQLTTRLIPADTSERWPIDLSDELGGDRFDAVMVLGLPAAAVGDSQWATIAELIAGGGGLLMLGGVGGDPAGYRQSPLAEVLPVQIAGRPEDASDERPVNLSVAAASGAAGHPIVQLGKDFDWQSLPPQLGIDHFAAARIAPGVQAILRATPVVGDRGRPDAGDGSGRVRQRPGCGGCIQFNVALGACRASGDAPPVLASNVAVVTRSPRGCVRRAIGYPGSAGGDRGNRRFSCDVYRHIATVDAGGSFGADRR